MDTAKRKVTVKLNYNDPSTSTGSAKITRPVSPTKPSAYQINGSIKPRAKVNSSANVLNRKPSSIVSSSGTSTKSSTISHNFGSFGRSTPRAVSPSKPPPSPLRNGPMIKARPTVRAMLSPPTTQSLPTTPITRHRSIISDSGIGPIPIDGSSTRRISITTASSPDPNYPDSTTSGDSSVLSTAPKIKAKLSGVAAKYTESITATTPNPVVLSQRLVNTKPREPYTSPVSSPPTDQYVFYPITTSTAAANPHRYARPNPPPNHHYHYQPFAPHPQENINNANVIQRRRASIGINGRAHVDPLNVPLPSHSPPASAVSFSSRSSVSRSSASFTVESQTNESSGNDSPSLTGEPLKEVDSENSGEGGSGEERDTDEELNEAEQEFRLEAKSIRKIQDLEISNRSLLAINSTLEATKNRQAKEIRELRRKLRESRLILPPRTFRAVKSSLDPAEDEEEESEEEEEEEKEECAAEEKPVDGDASYRRIKQLMEGLLEDGKRALEEPMVDFLAGPSASLKKVLTAEEVRDWRHSSGDIGDETRESIRLEDLEGLEPLSQTFDSEEEVEATLSRISASPSPPPIRITGPS